MAIELNPLAFMKHWRFIIVIVPVLYGNHKNLITSWNISA